MTETKRSKQPNRAPAPKLKERPITAADMASAARSLRWRLNSLVKELDTGNKRGLSDEKVWKTITFHQAPPVDRKLSRLSGTELALREYVRRSVHDSSRAYAGRWLAVIAFELVQGLETPEASLAHARALRGDGVLDEHGTFRELKSALNAARGAYPRFARVYGVLAQDADVSPVPDTARVKRGRLGAMFDALQARYSQSAGE